MSKREWEKMITDVRIYGLEESIIASGYPMISDKNKLGIDKDLTEKDLKRARVLGGAKAGSGHDVYLSGITVHFTVKYTAYWMLQAMRYTWFQPISSTSKMHKLLETRVKGSTTRYVDDVVVNHVESLIDEYHLTEDKDKKHELFMRILSNCPMGYEMHMRVSASYLCLKTMYKQRRNHKLNSNDMDWGAFCDFCESLEMFKELIGIEDGDKIDG